jgi:hypothetical protein
MMSTYRVHRCTVCLLLVLLPFTGCKNPPDAPTSQDPVKIIVVGTRFSSGSDTGADWWIKGFGLNGTEDTTHWNKVIDSGFEAAHSVAVDSGNNVYVSGLWGPSAAVGNMSWWMKKFDASGVEDSVQWNKQVQNGPPPAGLPADAILYRRVLLAVDGSDEVSVLGPDGSTSFSNSCLYRFTPAGMQLCSASGGSYFAGIWQPRSLTLDSSNLHYVAGPKIGASDLNWTSFAWDPSNPGQTSYLPAWDYNSGNGDDMCHSLAIDPSDNRYLVGYVSTTLRQKDWAIRKYLPTGIVDWFKVYDGAAEADGNLGDDIAFVAAVDPNGDIYVAGTTDDGAVTSWFIKKLDAAGVEDTAHWNKQCCPGSAGDGVGPRGIAFDADDNAYVIGSTLVDGTYSWVLKKFAPDGSEDTAHWNKSFEGGMASAIAIYN